MIIPIFKKRDRKQWTNYKGISLRSLPGKVCAKCLERKCRQIVESKLEDSQRGFHPGCSTMDPIFTLKQIFEKSWEYGKNIFACFVDLEKAYNRVSRDKLWKVSWEYGVDGRLIHGIKAFYCRPEVCVWLIAKQSKPFHVWCWTSVRVRFVTSLFHCWHGLDRQMQPSWWVCHDWKLKISRLQFFDDLILLFPQNLSFSAH